MSGDVIVIISGPMSKLASSILSQHGVKFEISNNVKCELLPLTVDSFILDDVHSSLKNKKKGKRRTYNLKEVQS